MYVRITHPALAKRVPFATFPAQIRPPIASGDKMARKLPDFLPFVSGNLG